MNNRFKIGDIVRIKKEYLEGCSTDSPIMLYGKFTITTIQHSFDYGDILYCICNDKNQILYCSQEALEYRYNIGNKVKICAEPLHNNYQDKIFTIKDTYYIKNKLYYILENENKYLWSAEHLLLV